ncbi:hypothetical protein A3Q56_00740 [Intoshia linei]|uniref:Ion transport domain-containing protein n=1 Tax=Intoshia linei TaxID=1819745 RepID=A0A177BB99_9BILA|nr:hypothetical protein A3Q56_00740 [Intoshia linei]
MKNDLTLSDLKNYPVSKKGKYFQFKLFELFEIENESNIIEDEFNSMQKYKDFVDCVENTKNGNVNEDDVHKYNLNSKSLFEFNNVKGSLNVTNCTHKDGITRISKIMRLIVKYCEFKYYKYLSMGLMIFTILILSYQTDSISHRKNDKIKNGNSMHYIELTLLALAFLDRVVAQIYIKKRVCINLPILAEILLIIASFASMFIQFYVDSIVENNTTQNNCEIQLDQYKTKTSINETYSSLRIFLTFLQSIKVFRVISLISYSKTLVTLSSATFRAMKEVLIVLLMLLLFGYIFDLLGVHFFKTKTTFTGLYTGAIQLFKLFTLDDWDKFHKQLQQGENYVQSTIFILTWIFVGFFIIQNVFIGIFQENIDSVNLEDYKQDTIDKHIQIKDNKTQVTLNIEGQDAPHSAQYYAVLLNLMSHQMDLLDECDILLDLISKLLINIIDN